MGKKFDQMMKLTEENARYRWALINLRTKMRDYKEKHKTSVLLCEEELNEVLEIAGLKDEKPVIYCDNDPNEVAYE